MSQTAVPTAILGLLAGASCTLGALGIGGMLGEESFGLAILFCTFGFGLTATMWLVAMEVSWQDQKDRMARRALEEHYANLFALTLTHIDRIDRALNLGPDVLQTEIRASIGNEALWDWVDHVSGARTVTPTPAAPQHIEILEIVNGWKSDCTALERLLQGQALGVRFMRDDVAAATKRLFEQVKALWEFRPRQASVRDIRQAILEQAWKLGAHLGDHEMTRALRQATPQAVAWLVRRQRNQRHDRLLKDYVLEGAVPADGEPEPELEPTPAA